jgi:hypothetical protein
MGNLSQLRLPALVVLLLLVLFKGQFSTALSGISLFVCRSSKSHRENNPQVVLEEESVRSSNVESPEGTVLYQILKEIEDESTITANPKVSAQGQKTECAPGRQEKEVVTFVVGFHDQQAKSEVASHESLGRTLLSPKKNTSDPHLEAYCG